MDLPVASQSYRPTPEAALRAILRARVILARTVADETAADAATLFSNPLRRSVGLANWAAEVRVVPGADPVAAVDEIMSHYRDLGLSCFQCEPAEPSWDPKLAAVIEAQDFRPIVRNVYVLEKRVAAKKINPSLQVIPARAAYGPLREFYEAMARDEHRLDAPTAAAVAEAKIDHLDEPRLEMFVGRLDQRIAGCAGVLTLGNIGVIQAAYTDVAARGKGVAGALMEYVLDHCHRAIFERVMLDRSEGCPSVSFYESLGFQRVTHYVRYRRRPFP